MRLSIWQKAVSANGLWIRMTVRIGYLDLGDEVGGIGRDGTAVVVVDVLAHHAGICIMLSLVAASRVTVCAPHA